MIAVYGGAFDPIHVGHMSAIYTARFFHDVKELYVVPSFNHVNKSTMSDFDKRIEWAEKAIEYCCQHEFGSNNIFVSDAERNIKKDNETVYTIDILDHFQKLFPEDKIAFVVGEDNDISKFKDVDKIKEKYQIIYIKIALHKCHSSLIRNSEYSVFQKYLPSTIVDDAYHYFNNKN